jgi:hypothetical protein
VDKDTFLAISAKAGEDEQIKLRVLWDAVLQNLKSYKAKYSQQNLKSWQSAEKALAEFAAQLESKEKTAAAKAGETLPNVLAVSKYLDSLGYKATTSTIYRHRDVGKISPQSDGLFNTNTVEQYAAVFLKKKDAARISPTADATDKDVSTARKMAAQAEHWEIKTSILRGEYVERAAFERGLARRAAIFKSDIENFIRNNSGEMIALVAGDATRAPDVIDFWLNESEKWLARYSENQEFELPAAVDMQRLEKVVA